MPPKREMELAIFLIRLGVLILLGERYEMVKQKLSKQYYVLIAVYYYLAIIYSESLSDGLYF